MIVTSLATHPRRRPLQIRSRATFDVIVEAAAQILVKQGINAFNTNDVAAKAGVSIGSVYQYFPDKACLLAELKRRNFEKLAKSAHDIYRNSCELGVEPTLRAAIRALIRHATVHDDLHLVLEKDVVVFPEATLSEVLQLSGVRDIRDFIERHRDEIVVSDLDVASFIIARTFRSVINAALLDCPEKLHNGVIENELTGFALRYLTARG